MNLFERTFYGNPFYDWVAVVAICIVLALILHFTKRFLIHRFTVWSRRTETRLDDFVVDILKHTRFLFLLVIAFYFGLQYLELPPKPTRLITHIAIIALLVQVALWGNRGIALAKCFRNNRRFIFITTAAAAPIVAIKSVQSESSEKAPRSLDR